jgi:hypothetical protein
VFNKRKILNLKVKIAGLKAELEEWREVEKRCSKMYPQFTTELVRDIAKLEAELKERTAYV